MTREEKPAWLRGLISEPFFVSCSIHESVKKNEKNIYCFQCCHSICQHCATSHRFHPAVQVRRYVYHDVIHLGDLEKLLDTTHLQSYTINNERAVFLKKRPQSRPSKGYTNICFTCDRILQEPFTYCSVECKVNHVLLRDGDLSTILHKFDASNFTLMQSDEFPIDVKDLLDQEVRSSSNCFLSESKSEISSGSSNHSKNARDDSENLDMNPGSKRKKEDGSVYKHRRKGYPQRSPLF